VPKRRPQIICIGDLVVVKEELQRVVDIKDWGIVIDEATILPSDVPDDKLEAIDSWVVFFPSTDDTFTIPKNCVRKIVVIQE
tara:strand:- start:2875 stop:3120 length:246 start_codon:yes stop_codon:yes gene_type:complete